MSLSTDYEAARASLNEQTKGGFLLLQLDKAVGETLQVVASGMGTASLSLAETDFSFILYRIPGHRLPYLLFYQGHLVPPHILSAVLVRFAAIVKLLEPFGESFLEISDPQELTEEAILRGVKRGSLSSH